jgi:hypothetical protein
MGNYDKILRIKGAAIDANCDLADEFELEMFSLSTRDAVTFEDGLIEPWEDEYEISDPAPTLQERQTELNALVRATGGDNFAYFKNLAAALGYNIDSVTDPHLRITDGDFPPARADYAQADISQVWDQESGASAYTWCVRGTDVESDSYLQDLFNKHKADGTEIVFINE